jgi:catechol 2,3-dioxygenase-like lactoylglutathione lyase family enzyme
MDMKLEVVVIPVADVDKAKDFYQGLGWRLDADFMNEPTNSLLVTLRDATGTP